MYIFESNFVIKIIIKPENSFILKKYIIYVNNKFNPSRILNYIYIPFHYNEYKILYNTLQTTKEKSENNNDYFAVK